MARFTDSWRSGGTGNGPYVLKPRDTTEIPLSVDGLATSADSDVLLRVRKSDGTVVFSVTNAGNLTFAGSGTVSIDTTVTGNLTVNGNTTLGNAGTDTITIAGATTHTGTTTFTGLTTFNSLATLNNGLTVYGTTNLNGVVNLSDGLSVGSLITFSGGQAITSNLYQVGRDADATNQLHFNVPTSASFEWSINDTPEMILSATNLTPGVNDGLALGVSGTAFSDLFFASGAIIDFAAGDFTITHSSNTLAFAGGVITHAYTLTDATTGFDMAFATSGAGSAQRNGLVAALSAGSTTSGITSVLTFDNLVAGTSALYQTDALYGSRPGGNRGTGGYSRGPAGATGTGHNVGGLFLASHGAVNWGTWAGTTVALAAVSNIGAIGIGFNDAAGGEGIGVYALYDNPSAVPTIPADIKTALYANNNSNAVDIAIFADNGTEVLSVEDEGILHFTKAVAGIAVDIDVTATAYTTVVGVVDIVRSGAITGVDTETMIDLQVNPTLTLTEPGAGTFNYYGANIDFSNVAITAGVGTSVLAALRLVANADADVGTNLALFVDAGLARFDDQIIFGAGTAVTAGNYSVGRDADGTNQWHANAPSGATYEFSINDTAELTLSATTLGLATNTITGIGTAITGTANTALTLSVPNQGANTNAGVGLNITADAGGSGTTGGAGGSITITAGDANGSGDNAGGDISLKPGIDTGAGAPGSIDLYGAGGAALKLQLSDYSVNDYLISADAGDITFFGIFAGPPTLDFAILRVASSANYLRVEGAAASAEPVLSAQGTDTDIDIKLAPKGAGNVVPTTSDDSALGSTSLMWSDLFLASGAVINFNAGDVTITHAANLLTIESGDLAMGNDALIRRDVNAAITASTTQTQGNGPLTAEINEISVVANANDTVTLPSAVVGYRIVIINNGANTLRIFPASGDNLGAGVDTATTLGSGSNIIYQAYDDTNWESI